MNILQFGRGKWGTNHNRILTEMGHQVSWIDIEWGWDFVGVIREHRGRNACDAVIITTSSVNHWPIAVYCLECNIPVFCEKPVLLKASQLENLKRVDDSNRIFMAGHQLVFMEDIDWWNRLHTGEIVYMNSMRNGGIPRDEGALFSLMVHDIAMAHHFMNVESFDCIDVDGNKHEIRASLVSGNKQVELYAISVSKVRMRHTTFVKESGEKLSVIPDNWNRMDLLKIELTHFLNHVEVRIPSDINGMRDTINVMETVMKIQAKLEEKK